MEMNPNAKDNLRMVEKSQKTWLQERISLGQTELKVGRLGLGSSYMAPARAFEAAFDAGCNLFYWGALRTPQMKKAMRHIIDSGKRDDIVIALQSYIRPRGLGWSVRRGLRRLGIGQADILLLGWHNRDPDIGTLDQAMALKEKGLFRYLGITGHLRPLFADIAGDSRFDLFMLRYNAAHRGAEQDVFPHLPEKRPGIIAFTATRWKSLLKPGNVPEHEKIPTAGDCYRFVLSHPQVDVAISGPSSFSQMEENLRETAKGPMTEKELDWMRRVGDSVYRK